jgi:carbamoyltransferase
MRILGISGLAEVEGFLRQHFPSEMARHPRVMQGMDAAATLIEDGRVVAAVSEERFDRIKKSPSFPFRAIDYCLAAGNVKFSQIDAVCFNFAFEPYRQVFEGNDTAKNYWYQCLSPVSLRNQLAEHYSRETLPPIKHIPHHASHMHAALASFRGGRALGIVMDAAGEIDATSVYLHEDGRVQRIGRYPISQSLGICYSLMTHFLGYAFNEDEYKVMGLAAFGDPERYAEFFEDAIRLQPEGRLEIPMLSANRTFTERLFFSSSLPRIRDGLGFDGAQRPMDQQHRDASAALQKRFTQALFHICRHFAERTKARQLILSGGCAENCAAIGELRASGMFEHIHVAYASGDEGTSLGAAAAHSFACGQPLKIANEMPFFGPAPRLEAVRAAVACHPDELQVDTYASSRDMLDKAAAEVADGKIVSLCDGRMEFGARALGNRSLLALPSDPAMKDRINIAIKKRQSYRPFAPAVIEEEAHRYFDLAPGEAYPYMTMLTRVREDFVARLPAIVHVDGTARVQTVSQVNNPGFHHFLLRLKARTGMPIVLNTSYNVNHQPIVCSEKDAVETFCAMAIDSLYIAQSRICRSSP